MAGLVREADADVLVCEDQGITGLVTTSSPVGNTFLATYHTASFEPSGVGVTISQLDFNSLGAFNTFACVPLGESLLGYSMIGAYNGTGVFTSFDTTDGAIGTPFETVFPGYSETDVFDAISTLNFGTLGTFSLDHYFNNQYSAFGGSGSLVGFSNGQLFGTVTASAVPEPGGPVVLLAMALFGVALHRRRIRRWDALSLASEQSTR